MEELRSFTVNNVLAGTQYAASEKPTGYLFHRIDSDDNDDDDDDDDDDGSDDDDDGIGKLFLSTLR